jgi:hypothetical protein
LREDRERGGTATMPAPDLILFGCAVKTHKTDINHEPRVINTPEPARNISNISTRSDVNCSDEFDGADFNAL